MFANHAEWKLLIVEDDDNDRRFLQRRVQQQWPNCDIREAATAEAGLLEVLHELPDLVLTDHRLPQTTGTEFIGTLHQQFPAVPVIMITGWDGEEVAVKALQAGAASYISKSMLDKHLIPTIINVMEMARSQSNRRRVISCLTTMEQEYQIGNDLELISPLIRYLQDQAGSMYLFENADLLRIGIALQECLSNAINHGNLELDSELRQEDESIFHTLGEARRVKWPYCDRKVRVRATFARQQVTFVIRDEGPGFLVSQVKDPTDKIGICRIGGRGLLLIRAFMDEVSHNARGNEVTLVKYTSAGSALLAQRNVSEPWIASSEMPVLSRV